MGVRAVRMNGPPPKPQRKWSIYNFVLNELCPWLKANRVDVGEGLRITQTYNGKVIDAPSPFKVTNGGGLVANRSSGWIYGRFNLTQEDLTATAGQLATYYSNARNVSAGTHTMTASKYNVIALRLAYQWVEPYEPSATLIPDYTYVVGDGAGSTVEEQKTIAQLNPDYYNFTNPVTVDTIDTTEWETNSVVLADTLANNLTADPTERDFTTGHFAYYPIAVVKTDASTITEITQILLDDFHDPFVGTVVQVPAGSLSP